MLRFKRKQIGALVALLIFSVLFTFFGIFFNDAVNAVIKTKLKETLPLTNGTIAFKFWQKPPVPINFGLYVFHVVNYEEVREGKGVPTVVEKGPYVYKMDIEKTNIIWHDNSTVEYIQPQHFFFDRESSVGPDTDTFITLNIPFITIATILQHENPKLQSMINAVLSNFENAFMNRSVYDIWWGYKDPVLEEAAKILHALNISIPMINGKFGFYMERNNTGDGLYNVFSGVNDEFGNYVQIDSWNHLKHLSVWKSDYANEIRGTDGSMQPPLVNENSKLSVFDTYLYRSLNLEYSGHSSYQGLQTLRFVVPYSEFANADENPNNAGFCTPDCIPSGAYNMSLVCYDAPIYLSLPHFLGGDDYYQSQVHGLSPSQSQHQPFYEIQPVTGVSMRIARRYQINVRTQSFQYFTKFEKFPVSYLPILWIDGTGDIDADTADFFKTMIQDTLDKMPYIHGAVYGTAGLLFLISLTFFIYWWKKNRNLLGSYSLVQDNETSILNGKVKTKYGSDCFSNHLNVQHIEGVQQNREDVQQHREGVQQCREEVQHRENVQQHREGVQQHREDVQQHREDVQQHREEVQQQREDIQPYRVDVQQHREDVQHDREDIQQNMEHVQQQNNSLTSPEHLKPNISISASNTLSKDEAENSQNENSREQSLYFDTQISPERSDKFLSLEVT